MAGTNAGRLGVAGRGGRLGGGRGGEGIHYCKHGNRVGVLQHKQPINPSDKHQTLKFELSNLANITRLDMTHTAMNKRDANCYCRSKHAPNPTRSKDVYTCELLLAGAASPPSLLES